MSHELQRTGEVLQIDSHVSDITNNRFLTKLRDANVIAGEVQQRLDENADELYRTELTILAVHLIATVGYLAANTAIDRVFP